MIKHEKLNLKYFQLYFRFFLPLQINLKNETSGHHSIGGMFTIIDSFGLSPRNIRRHD